MVKIFVSLHQVMQNCKFQNIDMGIVTILATT